MPSYGVCDEGGWYQGHRDVYLQEVENGGAVHS